MKNSKKQDKSLSIPEQPNICISPQNHNNQNNTQPNSNSVVYQRLHGGRDVVSVRVKPELKEALKRFCLANGLSICHVFEGLVTAFLYGVKQKIELVNQSPTIHLTLVRDVKRVRRYAYSYLDYDNGEVLVSELERSGNSDCVGVKARVRDYSGLSLEELERLRSRLLELGDSTEVQFVAFEIRKRKGLVGGSK